MSLYKIGEGDTLTKINSTFFASEKALQRLIERNLKPLFGLDFISTEFTLDNCRFDTLAFEPGDRTFVVIEYKNRSNQGVFDQVLGYANLMRQNKAEIVIEYNVAMNQHSRPRDFNWDKCKVIVISPEFSRRQLDALKTANSIIFAWEIKNFGGTHIWLERVDENAAVAPIPTPPRTPPPTAEDYTVEKHLKRANEDIKKLYKRLEGDILRKWKLTPKPMVLYIAFKLKTNVTDVEIQKSQLKIFLNLPIGSLRDERNLCRDVSNIGHWGNGDYQVIMKDDSDYDYILGLIEQSVNYEGSRSRKA